MLATAGPQTAPAVDMVLVPAGSNNGTNELAAMENNATVLFSATYALTSSASFYMDANLVTKTRWDQVYSWAVTNGYGFDNAGTAKATNHPVQTVNWYDCLKWCNARSERDGLTPCYTVTGAVYRTGRAWPACNMGENGYRLPTGVEWEYAARGGQVSKRFPWGNTIAHSNANYQSDSWWTYDVSATRGFHPMYNTGGTPKEYTSAFTSPAGAFAPNAYGLYDMAGNVWQWCWESIDGAPCLRGGCWYSYADLLRCGSRNLAHPIFANYDRGLRCVRAAP
jgi:formylglycine-generating enzyme required for sulfatase activity